ncbi:hypothetical protein L1987_57895 [Smallanthus sonchifolius]|uniref:Uncharacterized protein n=1 Tax=Smallanthus sonchifolius TaxID=185202 RepID=A0ACB9DE08_9ASTR|nr:hypothetical protein L1987_57895 [Smallanthus sonchifolius]
MCVLSSKTLCRKSEFKSRISLMLIERDDLLLRKNVKLEDTVFDHPSTSKSLTTVWIGTVQALRVDLVHSSSALSVEPAYPQASMESNSSLFEDSVN